MALRCSHRCAARAARRAPGAAGRRALSSSSSAHAETHEYMTSSVEHGSVALVTLTRPKALNALCDGLFAELNALTKQFDADPSIGCIVLTGAGEKAFVAGADIKEMAARDFSTCYDMDMFAQWHEISKLRTPTIAAVNGFALGGGCELAMLCDMIYCAEGARFGQPEITLGVIPGGGGTQRLTHAVGKSKAMDMLLTGEMIGADEAKACGLVSRVFPQPELLPQTLKLAAKIAGFSRPAAQMTKETVNAAYEMSLESGVRFERRLFHAAFSTADQKEGMAAFQEKRPAEWKHK